MATGHFSGLPTLSNACTSNQSTYVAFNDENGGLNERLREDGIVDLDAAFCSLPEWISMESNG
ncbi:hypothetical protein NC652_015207 [Populus alba x Populus x berolinensis]|nr:hypothetical protein NC652_015207 [Populus alba x Populus x berolinensis]